MPTLKPLYKRSLAIGEKAFGPDHPDVARSLNNLAAALPRPRSLCRCRAAVQAVADDTRKSLGPDHPDVAISLNNLADLYRAQGRYADALPIVQRTISQNSARKPVAFAVLYGSRSQNLISPRQALDASYTVLQRSAIIRSRRSRIETCSSLCGGH